MTAANNEKNRKRREASFAKRQSSAMSEAVNSRASLDGRIAALMDESKEDEAFTLSLEHPVKCSEIAATRRLHKEECKAFRSKERKRAKEEAAALATP